MPARLERQVNVFAVSLRFDDDQCFFFSTKTTVGYGFKILEYARSSFVSEILLAHKQGCLSIVYVWLLGFYTRGGFTRYSTFLVLTTGLSLSSYNFTKEND